MSSSKKQFQLDTEKLKKGQLLVVKAAPFFDREYIYEISGAGGKVLRANLYHSPTVKKQWAYDDLKVLFINGLIRFAEDEDLKKLNASQSQAKPESEEDPD
ncbi:MAG: hypothetical protein K2X27_11110 [Candidatus Obscuribacterales bacterium]|nr:hypothetical protein [Candidatus Obscuribacterales bacterium]